MPLPHVPPVRLSLNQVVTELHITANKVRAGLKAHATSAGKDGRYSLKEVFDALNGLSPLEIAAKKARFEAQIDEAQFQRHRRAEIEGRLLPTDEVSKYFRDFFVTTVQFIKHSSLRSDEKSELIDRIGNITLSEGKNKKKHLNHNGQDTD